jgi:hypothetical protein
MAAEPYDEPEIENNDVIIRRVNPAQHVVPDETTGKLRTSSKLFSPSSGPKGGMSVDLLRLMEAGGINAREFVTTPVFTGSVCFSADAARTAGLRVGYDPVEGNPYHGEVWGSERQSSFTRPQKRLLAAASTWFVELPGVEIKI